MNRTAGRGPHSPAFPEARIGPGAGLAKSTALYHGLPGCSPNGLYGERPVRSRTRRGQLDPPPFGVGELAGLDQTLRRQAV